LGVGRGFARDNGVIVFAAEIMRHWCEYGAETDYAYEMENLECGIGGKLEKLEKLNP